MKLIACKCILVDKYCDKGFVLIGSNSKAFKDCGLPIYIKCAIAMGLKFNNSFYCSHDCMREDEMKHNSHSFKCVTLYEDEYYFYSLREVDTIKEVFSQFLEIIMGNSYQSFKNCGARIAYKGASLSPDDKIFSIFSKEIINIFMLILDYQLKRILSFQSSRLNALIRKRKLI